MKWIKASERFPVETMPESLENVTIRYIGKKYPPNNIIQYLDDYILCGIDFSNMYDIQYSQIEWLDETTCKHEDTYDYWCTICNDCGIRI